MRRQGRSLFSLERLEPRWAFAIGFGDGVESPVVIDPRSEDPIMTITSSGETANPLVAFESTEALQRYVLDAALSQYESLFGQPTWGGGWWGTDLYGEAHQLTPAATEANRNQAGLGSDFSGTNVQVAGVDEGDLVKTDGSFLYYLADGEVSIIDVRDPSQLQVVSRIPQQDDAWPVELYVVGDRLTLVSPSQRVGLPELRPINPGRPVIMTSAMGFPSPEPWEPFVQVDVYDITDRGAPQLLQTKEVDGQLVETRLVDETLILVMQTELSLPAPVSYSQPTEDGERPESEGDDTPLMSIMSFEDEPVPVAFAMSEPRIGLPWIGWGERYVYESREEYLARMQVELDPALLLPMLRVIDATGTTVSSPLFDATQVLHQAGSAVTNLLSVVLLDIGQPQVEPISAAAALVQAGSVVYASTDSVFIAATQWDMAVEQTTIFRFALSDTTVELASMGTVPGRPLNQFALDAHQGYLRIATTQGWWDTASNNLYVLGEEAGQLNVVGAVEGLAPGESIFAARFFGDRAFLVTFRQVDPLFAIDLSDPTAPTVTGELKIPGFSHYLHGVEDDHLFGLGRDADVETGRPGLPQLSLFDVSDMAQPTVVDQTLIEIHGQGWSHSDAFFDHHAIGYFPSYQTLVIPFHESGWEVASNAAGQPTDRWFVKHNFWVFRLNPAEGTEAIEVVGQIEHGSPAMRSVRIGEVLYTLSVETIQAHSLLDLSQKLGELSLVSPVVDDYFWVASDAREERLDVLANDRLDEVPADAVISSVTQPSSGGTVTIAADGLSLLYTPGDSFLGADFFEYTYADRSAQVVVHVHEVSDRLRVRLEVTDAAGQPISLVELGQEFQVNVWLEDSAGNPAPVTSAFMDLQFDPKVAKAVGSFTTGSGFNAQQRFDNVVVPGRMTNVGGLSVSDTGVTGDRLLARIPMRASDLGKTGFHVDQPEVLAATEEQLGFGQRHTAAFEFKPAQLRVIDGFHNSRLASDSNDDGHTTPQDALLVINFLLRHGARTVDDLRSLLSAEGEDFAATAANGVFNRYLDNNNDRHVTPMDVLLVVNRLNRNLRSLTSSDIAEGELDGVANAAPDVLGRADWLDWNWESMGKSTGWSSEPMQQPVDSAVARPLTADPVLMTKPASRLGCTSELASWAAESLSEQQAAADSFFKELGQAEEL